MWIRKTLNTAARIGLMAALGFATVAHADFPDRPVQMVVPVPTGGGTDAMARQVAKMLSQLWGQPVVVDNKAGAAGIIGAQAVMKMPPDGYTLLMSHDGVITATSLLFKRPDFDPIKQLAPISQLASLPHVVSVNPSVPAKNIQELVTLMRLKAERKESFGFATSALGSADHLAGEQFKQSLGLQMLVVPYKSTMPAMTDVVAGHVPFGFFAISAALPMVKNGNLRAIAITSAKRSKLLPQVPTVAETIPGFETYSWFGLWAPAGTPAKITEKISADIRKIFATPEMNAFIEANGFDSAISTPAEFSEFIRKEAAKTAGLIQFANIKIE
jgi:hypothetical protein